MKIVAQSGTADRKLALFGSASLAGLNKNAGNKIKHILEVGTEGLGDGFRADQCDSARGAVDGFAGFLLMYTADPV